MTKHAISIDDFDEAKFKAEMDANTMADANAISADGKRMKAASKAAKRLEKEMSDKARGMKKVAKRGSKKL